MRRTQSIDSIVEAILIRDKRSVQVFAEIGAGRLEDGIGRQIGEQANRVDAEPRVELGPVAAQARVARVHSEILQRLV
jgi:hypothetical protein